MKLSREQILQICSALEIGQCVQFDPDNIHDAFPVFMTEWRTARERLLSNLPGSGWGAYTVDEPEFFRDSYRVCRHPEGNRRVYVDPDREHRFEKTADGFYEPIGRKEGPRMIDWKPIDDDARSGEQILVYTQGGRFCLTKWINKFSGFQGLQEHVPTHYIRLIAPNEGQG